MSQLTRSVMKCRPRPRQSTPSPKRTAPSQMQISSLSERQEYASGLIAYQSEYPSTGGVTYQPGYTNGGEQDVEELNAMDEEMPRVRSQRERLNEMHSLEARQEELRRGVEARRAAQQVLYSCDY